MSDAFSPLAFPPVAASKAHSAHPPELDTRELRTRSVSPSAPAIESLLSREGNGGVPPQTLVVWDVGHTWPTFSLTQLDGSDKAAPTAHASTRVQRVMLRQEGSQATLAEFLIALLPGHTEAKRWGVIQVRTSPGDPLGTRVALGLLEQADRAVLLAGAPSDKDLLRRLTDFSRSAPWGGPSLLLVSPADKPSRADRLRRSNWPRGLRTHVLEVFPGSEPGWSAQLLAMVLGEGAAADSGGAHVAATAPLRSDRTGGNGTEAALTLVTQAPGVVASALFDASSGDLCAVQGARDEATAAAGRATRMLQALDEAAALEELTWHSAKRLNLVLALPDHPRLHLLAVADRDFGELAALRWHLAVARSQLG